MDVIIDYDGNEVITNETCSICLDELNDDINDIHELPECKHKFHSKCLITYLRTGNRSCPLCRGVANEIVYINSFIYGNNSISTVINYAKRENANKKIKKIVERYKNLKKKYKESQKISSNFKKELKNNKEFQELTKKRNLLNFNKLKKYQNLKKMERQISSIVMLPIQIRN